MYKEWGFSDNPFRHIPLQADEDGAALLVGRNHAVQELANKLVCSNRIQIIEGVNGIGKTSFANVVVYALYQRHLKDGSVPLFLPCRNKFQITSGSTVASFVEHVLFEIAQTLLSRQPDLTKCKHSPNFKELDNWLNQSHRTALSGGAYGFNFGAARTPNTTSGFDKSGFRKLVLDCLTEAFTEGDGKVRGGMVCLLDNLELLQSSQEAAHLVEELRDELFDLAALRWILCGAQGITHGVASSTRLSGYLYDPLALSKIVELEVPKILLNRMKRFAEREDAYIPLLQSDFVNLYNLFRGNIRETLARADDFCLWTSHRAKPITSEEKHSEYITWLDERAVNIYEDVISRLTEAGLLDTLRTLMETGGECAPNDCRFFGFDQVTTFLDALAELYNLRLITNEPDTYDKRRRTIQISPKGWFLSHFLYAMGNPNRNPPNPLR